MGVAWYVDLRCLPHVRCNFVPTIIIMRINGAVRRDSLRVYFVYPSPSPTAEPQKWAIECIYYNELFRTVQLRDSLRVYFVYPSPSPTAEPQKWAIECIYYNELIRTVQFLWVPDVAIPCEQYNELIRAVQFLSWLIKQRVAEKWRIKTPAADKRARANDTATWTSKVLLW
jgi:hypothetical protein